MNTFYGLLFGWWRKVMLWELLVVCACTVLVVPTASVQAQGGSLSCLRRPAPAPCTVVVVNNGNQNIYAQAKYRNGDTTTTSSQLLLRPGETFAINATYLRSVTAHQAIPFGETFVPEGDTLTTVFDREVAGRDTVTVNVSYNPYGRGFRMELL